MADLSTVPESFRSSGCIMFATADWDEPYWTNKQHCAISMARMSKTVLYVESVGLRNPKAASKKDWGRLISRLFKGLSSLIFGAKERSPNIYVLSPLVIPAGYQNSLLQKMNKFLLGFMLKRAEKRCGFIKPVVWTYHPFMRDVLGYDHDALIYHCVDNIAVMPGIDAEVFLIEENKLLKQASVVFATTQTLVNRCRQENPNTYYFPNVVDAEHFGRAIKPGDIPTDLEVIPEPRLCYHGVLSEFKVDFQLLYDAAILAPEWHWVYIGEEREGQNNRLVKELAKLDNVHFLGYRDYQSLPDYLRGMQLGLLPSRINEYTKSMFPMKYYEFLAAGLRIVTTPLEFTKDCKGGMEIATTAEDFLMAAERQLELGRLSQEHSRVLVGNNTWDERLKKMWELIPS